MRQWIFERLRAGAGRDTAAAEPKGERAVATRAPQRDTEQDPLEEGKQQGIANVD